MRIEQQRTYALNHPLPRHHFSLSPWTKVHPLGRDQRLGIMLTVEGVCGGSWHVAAWLTALRPRKYEVGLYRAREADLVTIQRFARLALVGVGATGRGEWWWWNPKSMVGHLYVPLSDEEYPTARACGLRLRLECPDDRATWRERDQWK